MTLQVELPTGRRSFRPLIPEIAIAAELLSGAVDAHVAGEFAVAEDRIRRADDPILREWLDSIWGKASRHIHYRPVAGSPARIAGVDRVKQRMPDSAARRALIERDGFHCRLCRTPVIRAEIRRAMHHRYPQALPWGRKNIDQHAAFQVMWLQYDHLIPHARGGDNSASNMLIACAACNFGRMNYTLEEVGFAPPGAIVDQSSGWDGLERFMA